MNGPDAPYQPPPRTTAGDLTLITEVLDTLTEKELRAVAAYFAGYAPGEFCYAVELTEVIPA
ncbi:MAG TPA: hypothetical protein VH641_14445 [Streptosporangiaceae bacterium]